MVGAGVMGRGYVDAAGRMGVRVVLVDLPPRRAIYGEIVDEFHDCPDPAVHAGRCADQTSALGTAAGETRCSSRRTSPLASMPTTARPMTPTAASRAASVPSASAAGPAAT
jgi:hypothetical protein